MNNDFYNIILSDIDSLCSQIKQLDNIIFNVSENDSEIDTVNKKIEIETYHSEIMGKLTSLNERIGYVIKMQTSVDSLSSHYISKYGKFVEQMSATLKQKNSETEETVMTQQPADNSNEPQIKKNFSFEDIPPEDISKQYGLKKIIENLNKGSLR